jgi:tetratricopeptide (TPR) repeat protein
MNVMLPIVFASFSIVVWVAPEEKPITLHLADGTPVSGVILDNGFDEATGVTLRRDDNGGLLRLRWDQVLGKDVERVKRAFGFAGDEAPVVQLDALKVTTTTGEIVGIDAGREGDAVLIRRKNEITRVPQASIRNIETVVVDALDVEDPTVLYERRLAKIDQSKAIDWYNLALTAEGLMLYEQAKHCHDTVLDIDPEFPKRDLIRERKTLLDVKMGEREQTEALMRVRSLKAHKRFPEAATLAQEFITKWPSSRQLAQAQRELKDIAARQKEAMLAGLRTNFFSILEKQVLHPYAYDRKRSLGESMTYAQEEAFDATIERLSKYLKIDPDATLALWQERGSEGSPNTASYGGGTFILGEDAKKGYDKKAIAAAKEAKEKEAKEAEEGKKKNGEKSLEDKINEKLKEKAKAREARNAKRKQAADVIADVPPTQEQWWAAASTDERLSFLVAFFAEKSGKVNVQSLDQRMCSTCAGNGSIEMYHTQSGPNGESDEAVPCPRCKTLGFDRLVKFK